ncbi:helix-turn-helix domain-containing protein [Stutzerimonas nitrititolerans]|uniref:helix-turn-helix domain-containing protein n=1 Tax=Stutzerimonas nitrititolerans TaxID=2482751 RepID=UPI0035E3E9F1
MDYRQALGSSLRKFRRARGLSQESFMSISSRAHISMLERGLKGVTIEKMIEIAEVMRVHPLTVLLDSFSSYEGIAPERLLKQIAHEHNEIGSPRSNEDGA